MGFDLKAKIKGVEDFSCGAFFWPWMLGQGVGLPIAYGDGLKPGTFIYTPDTKGRSPGYNDGCAISAGESKMMGACAAGFAKILKHRQKEWDALPEQERKQYEENKSLHDYLKRPVRSDWVDQLEKFAEFAKASGGFRIC